MKEQDNKPEQNPWVATCSVCACFVAPSKMERHLEWHRTLTNRPAIPIIGAGT